MPVVVLTFGRMNPVTKGHAKLVAKLRKIARGLGGTPMVFLSHSQDKDKNPLSYQEKGKWFEDAFGKGLFVRSSARTIIEVLKELDKDYTKACVVVGDDRVREFDKFIQKYNGKDFNFLDGVETISAGHRDPDASGVAGMSASKMRDAARNNDFTSFQKGVPIKIRDKKKMFNQVRKGMGL